MPISLTQNRDCMEALREFPDKFFDLAVVDPPYGINITGAAGATHTHTHTASRQDRKHKAIRQQEW